MGKSMERGTSVMKRRRQVEEKRNMAVTRFVMGIMLGYMS